METRNPTVIKAIQDASEMQTPEMVISSQITPVIDVLPAHNRVCNKVVRVSGTATGSLTIYTAPSDQDFYLTGFQIALTKDAACDNAIAQLTFTGDDGVSGNCLAELDTQPTTAGSFTLSRDLTRPLRIKAGSTIALAANLTAGTFRKTAILYGYLCKLNSTNG